MRHLLLALTFAAFVVVAACDRKSGATPPAASSAELTVTRALTLPGGNPDQPDVTLGIIPTRPITVATWINPATNAVEQRITPAILHPIPALRAAHVMAFDQRPDPATVGLDTLMAAEGEAQLTKVPKYALIATRAGEPFLLTLSGSKFPEDRQQEWSVHVSAERVTLPEHVADAVADRGRAVPAREPLPLTGRLVYGRKNEDHHTWTLVSRDASPKGAGKLTALTPTGADLRVATNGAFADRTDENTIEVSDKAGRRVGTIKVDMPIEDFNLSLDGRRVALSTERRPLDKDGNLDLAGKNRPVCAVYDAASGKLVGEIEGRDDAAFLPDGRLIVTGRGFGPGLFIADLSTGKQTPITFDGGKEGGEPPATAESPRTPAVSPDGQRLAYCDGRDVYVVGLDGRHWTPIWTNPQHEPQHRPVFSPDGRYLAIINCPLNVMNGPGQVIVFDLKNQTSQPLGSGDMADSDGPLGWLP